MRHQYRHPATATLLATTALIGLTLTHGAAAAEITLGTVQVEDSTPAPVQGYQALRSSTATKTDTPLSDVPQSVTVVTREAMEDQGVRSMADAVRYVPGVTAAQGEGNRDAMVIRGNSSTADFFNNGVRDDTQYYRDAYNVDRVEVLKGSNAMVFGRGGGGGVINRVMKEADGRKVRQLSTQTGSFDVRRATADVGDKINDKVAVRLNGMYEDSESYRDFTGLDRLGLNPTVTLQPSDATTVKLSYEYLKDDRTADRGIPAFRGKPLDVDSSDFFGNPDLSFSEAEVNMFDALVEHELADGLTLRNRSRYAEYDKFYQNVFPSTINAAGTQVTLAAYNNGTERENLFNQTDLLLDAQTGSVKHKLLAGIEVGRQATDGQRLTGRFSNGLTTRTVSSLSGVTWDPVTFSVIGANDGATSTRATVAALYGQDQIELSEQWQVIGGLRFDRFDIDYSKPSTGAAFSRADNLISPRLGVVFKPVKPLSLYTSYSVSHLPYSGDQFGSLDATTSALKPEKFENYEIGAKWEVSPALSLTTAVYQLDRSNTRAVDPNNPGVTVQTGEQRTRGFELGASGNITPAWQVTGGYGYQNAQIVSATSAARKGATVALVPEHTFSLWNKYQFTQTWGAGLGLISQTGMYAGADNTVKLPGFMRADFALFANLTDTVRAQLNVQNVLDTEYAATAHSNNNITPGAPRSYLLTLVADF